MENGNFQTAGHSSSSARSAMHFLENLKSALEAEDQEREELRRTLVAKVLENQKLTDKVAHLLEENTKLRKHVEMEAGRGGQSEVKTGSSTVIGDNEIRQGDDDDSNAITLGKVAASEIDSNPQHGAVNELNEQRISKEYAQLQEHRYAEILKRNQTEIDKITERSRASYVARLEDVMKEYPDGLVAGEFLAKHQDVVREAKKLCEMEIRKKIPEVKPLQLASFGNCMQAYAEGYWKYFCEANNRNLSNKKARDEEARKCYEEQLIARSYRTQIDPFVFNPVFAGRYEMTSSVNFGEYLKAIGVGMIARQLSEKARPTVEITASGGRCTLRTFTALKNTEINFALGEEFDDTATVLDERLKAKSTITRDGNKLIHVQKIEGDEAKTVTEFFDSEMKSTFSAKGVSAVRTYKRL